jgi:hypothetical protein
LPGKPFIFVLSFRGFARFRPARSVQKLYVLSGYHGQSTPQLIAEVFYNMHNINFRGGYLEISGFRFRYTADVTGQDFLKTLRFPLDALKNCDFSECSPDSWGMFGTIADVRVHATDRIYWLHTRPEQRLTIDVLVFCLADVCSALQIRHLRRLLKQRSIIGDRGYTKCCVRLQSRQWRPQTWDPFNGSREARCFMPRNVLEYQDWMSLKMCWTAMA